MGRFINGDRPRTSPRSRLNNRISPARFDTPTPLCQQNGDQTCENASNEDQPTTKSKQKNKTNRSKRRPLRRSRRKLVLMKSQHKLKKRSCTKRIIFGVPESKPGKLPDEKAKNVKKTKK